MKHLIQTQIKINEAFGEFVSKLNSNFDSMSTHQKMLETQLSQIPREKWLSSL